METAIMTYFNRIVQNGVDIKDQRYWGIMGTNRIKNVHFTDSTISRFDAHCGFWNASLTGMVKPEGLSEYFLASDPQRNKACRLSYW